VFYGEDIKDMAGWLHFIDDAILADPEREFPLMIADSLFLASATGMVLVISGLLNGSVLTIITVYFRECATIFLMMWHRKS
jgi:hypothetical protein